MLSRITNSAWAKVCGGNCRKNNETMTKPERKSEIKRTHVWILYEWRVDVEPIIASSNDLDDAMTFQTSDDVTFSEQWPICRFSATIISTLIYVDSFNWLIRLAKTNEISKFKPLFNNNNIECLRISMRFTQTETKRTWISIVINLPKVNLSYCSFSRRSAIRQPQLNFSTTKNSPPAIPAQSMSLSVHTFRVVQYRVSLRSLRIPSLSLPRIHAI